MADKTIRSRLRPVVTAEYLLLGPLFVGGPIAMAVWLLFFSESFVGTFETVLLSAVVVCGTSCTLWVLSWACHWVELDGEILRGRKFWTRRLVEHRVDEIQDVHLLVGIRPYEASSTDELLGPICGCVFRFQHGAPLRLLEMTDMNKLALTLLRSNSLPTPARHGLERFLTDEFRIKRLPRVSMPIPEPDGSEESGE